MSVMKRPRVRLVAAALTLAGAGACSSSNATHTAITGTPSAEQGDRAWLMALHQANLAEIEAGELAKKKGATSAVRSVGGTLVTDHTASDAQVTRVAKDLGVTLPSSAAPSDAAAASRLGNETGAAFDQDFLATMTTGHEKLIARTRTEIGEGSEPQIKSLARDTLPVLKKHLSMVRKAAATG
jgi:putative membrane protein